MNRKKKSYLFYILIAVFLIYIIFFDGYSFLKLSLLRKNYQKLNMEMLHQKKENERLKKENDELRHNNKLLEQEARKLGMQKEGEEIFLFKEEQDKRKR